MLQINLGRGKICTEETVKFGECTNIDIILMQEPYVRDGRLSAQRARQFYKAEEGMVWAAVAVLNEKYQARLIEERSSCDVAVVKVRTDKGFDFTVVSTYSKADISMQAYLMKFEVVLRDSNGRNTILGMDANAKSALWHSARTDQRGDDIEDFILTNGVEVINSRQSLTTFEDSRGRGDNIDVTLMTADCARRTQGWKVIDEELSDHRRIPWTVTEEGNAIAAPEDPGSMRRLNLRGADWARIIQDARREFAALDGLMETITMEEGAGLLQEAIWKIYAENVVKTVQGKKNNRWWTPRISEMRGDMRRKRKRWLRTRTEVDRGLFVRARNEYKSEIWKEKRKAWEELVMRDDRGDPWGKVYKILSANKSTTVLTSMKTGDAEITTR